MIEKMKKLIFLVTDKEYDSFIASLRELGVVHIQQLQKGATSQELQDGMALEQRYKAAIQALEIYAKTYDGMEVPQAMDESTSPVALLQHIEDLLFHQQVQVSRSDLRWNRCLRVHKQVSLQLQHIYFPVLLSYQP